MATGSDASTMIAALEASAAKPSRTKPANPLRAHVVAALCANVRFNSKADAVRDAQRARLGIGPRVAEELEEGEIVEDVRYFKVTK